MFWSFVLHLFFWYYVFRAFSIFLDTLRIGLREESRLFIIVGSLGSVGMVFAFVLLVFDFLQSNGATI